MYMADKIMTLMSEQLNGTPEKGKSREVEEESEFCN